MDNHGAFLIADIPMMRQPGIKSNEYEQCNESGRIGSFATSKFPLDLGISLGLGPQEISEVMGNLLVAGEVHCTTQNIPTPLSCH